MRFYINTKINTSVNFTCDGINHVGVFHHRLMLRIRAVDEGEIYKKE
jgi:hypothetical protein